MTTEFKPEIELSPRQELFNELVSIFDGVTKRDAAPLHVIILWFEAIGADSAAHFLREFSKEYDKAHKRQRAADVPPPTIGTGPDSSAPPANAGDKTTPA